MYCTYLPVVGPFLHSRTRDSASMALNLAAAVWSTAALLPSLRPAAVPTAAQEGRLGGGGYAAALKACGDVLFSPQEAHSWQELGTLLHGKGRLEAAAFALQRSTSLQPHNDAAHIALAEVLRALGRFEEAFASLHAAEAITGKPNQALCYSGYRPAVFANARSASNAPFMRPSAIQSRLGGVRLTDVATADECDWVISTAEAHNTAKGGWACRQPRYAPAGTAANAVRAPDMLVADEPRLLEWLNRRCEETILPTLEAQFGLPASELWLYDTFILKFSGRPGERGLGIHVDDDGLGISFNVLLSDPSAFEGGGTRFPPNAYTEDEVVYAPQRGQMLSHYGGLRHASVPCTSGLRYIMVGFLRSRPLVQLGYLPD